MSSFYAPSNDVIPASVAGVLVSVALFFLVVMAAFYVTYSLFYAKLFAKAGVSGAWRAWVPVYREMIFAKLGDLRGRWVAWLVGGTALLYLIPFVGSMIGWIGSVALSVYLALAAYRVQSKLQKDGAWIVLYIFVSPVWLGIMAYDSSRWNTRIPRPAWADNALADKTAWNGVPSQAPAGGYPFTGFYTQADYGQPGPPPSQTLPTPPPASPGDQPRT